MPRGVPVPLAERRYRVGTPPIVTGEDGLPHCGWCLSDKEEMLCDYHRGQIRTALGQMLTSANILASASVDIRFIIGRRHKLDADSMDA